MYRHLPSIRSFAAAALLFGLLGGFCRFAPDAVKAASSSGSFKGGRAAVARALPERMPLHDRLVDAAGLFARLAGWRLFNGVVRMKEGRCTREMRWVADGQRLARLVARSTSGRGSPFLFVLAPVNVDRCGTLMPKGLRSSVNGDVGPFVEALMKWGVTTLDLRETFADTPDAVCQNFYRSDAHWNLLAAWRAAAMVSDRLVALMGDAREPVRSVFSEEKWATQSADKPWRGYFAERTGRHFGGMDTVFWKEPRQPMTLRRVEADGREVRGSFKETVMEYRGKEQERAWNGIIGGRSRSTVVYENEGAPSPRTVLVVKDSFGRPLAAYLSVAFRRVVAVDPRRLPIGVRVRDLIRTERPDVVVECVNAQLFSEMREVKALRDGYRDFVCWD